MGRKQNEIQGNKARRSGQRIQQATERNLRSSTLQRKRQRIGHMRHDIRPRRATTSRADDGSYGTPTPPPRPPPPDPVAPAPAPVRCPAVPSRPPGRTLPPRRLAMAVPRDGNRDAAVGLAWPPRPRLLLQSFRLPRANPDTLLNAADSEHGRASEKPGKGAPASCARPGDGAGRRRSTLPAPNILATPARPPADACMLAAASAKRTLNLLHYTGRAVWQGRGRRSAVPCSTTTAHAHPLGRGRRQGTGGDVPDPRARTAGRGGRGTAWRGTFIIGFRLSGVGALHLTSTDGRVDNYRQSRAGGDANPASKQ